jgi:hypothetical protein
MYARLHQDREGRGIAPPPQQQLDYQGKINEQENCLAPSHPSPHSTPRPSPHLASPVLCLSSPNLLVYRPSSLPRPLSHLRLSLPTVTDCVCLFLIVPVDVFLSDCVYLCLTVSVCVILSLLVCLYLHVCLPVCVCSAFSLLMSFRASYCDCLSSVVCW